MRPRAFHKPATPAVRRQARRIARIMAIGYTSIAVGLTVFILARTPFAITPPNLFSAAIGSAAATEPQQGLAACAARDLRLVTLIEYHGEQQSIAADQLAHAYFTVMDARNACRAGRFAEALRIYDGIVLEPIVTQRTQ